jgi:hypothetical protein
MKPLPKSTFDGAAQIHMVSNTPMYLYKHLRQNADVSKVADQLTTAELLKSISFYTTGKGTKLDEAVVAAYACLVALSFKPLSEFEDDLKALDASCLRWLPELREIILSQNLSSRIEFNTPIIQESNIQRVNPADQKVKGKLTPTIWTG